MDGIRMAIVTYEHEGFTLDANGGKTIGQSIDEMIGKAIEAGTEVREVTFEVDPNEWHAFTRQLAENNTPAKLKR